jgi:hypothetical protein
MKEAGCSGFRSDSVTEGNTVYPLPILRRAPSAARTSRRSGALSLGSGPAPAARDVRIQRAPSCACGGGCPRCRDERIHPKLAVSQPHDPLERDADRAAERAMRAEVSAAPRAPRAPLDALAGRGDDLAPAGGRPLEGGARTDMEKRFGADLGVVRVHTGEGAARSASGYEALAYTAGRNIVFGEGQYAPESASGRRLLAHELAHVVQQTGGTAASAPTVQRDAKDDAPSSKEQQVIIVADNLGCPREKCAGREDGIKADLQRALAYIRQALSSLEGKPSAATERLLGWYFSDHSDATVKTVRERLGCIRAALQDTFDNDRYGCGTRTWAHAHTGGSDSLCVDSGAPVCLDPSYFTELSPRERAEALVHECGHRMGLSSGGTPDIYSPDWKFLTLSTAQTLLNTDSYAMFVGAVALGARTTWMPLLGVGGGVTSLGGGFGKFQLGVEAQHPKLRGISPGAGLSISRMDSETIASLFLSARLADPRPGKKGSIYLGLSGELSFIAGDTFAVGVGAEAKLGYRIGRFDIGVTGGVLRDPSPDAGSRTVYTGGLSITVIPDFWSK